MRRSTLRSVPLAAAAMLAVLLAASAAARPSADDVAERSFERLHAAHNYAGFKPASVDPNRQVRVIVEVQGESVGAVMSRRDLSREEKEAIRADLRSKQQAAKDAVRSLGGTVLADYQDAYNGVAARVALKDLAALRGAPNVVAVHPVRTFELDNTAGVQFIQGDDAWTDLGLTGNGVKVAIIDTGVDYTHATFAGAGTESAFQQADANDTTLDGTEFRAKVVGGYDFVGDAYTGENTAQPDPDPLDCNGHGTHVAGTAAGAGVLQNGSTYAGPYDSTTYSRDFRVGPGVAPKASVLAYRVFGCSGFTTEDIIVAALNRALTDGADVVNMSLGSPFGRTDEPSAEASNTLAEAGVVVVASAGNSGPSGYITGAPAIADRAISVAAIDASREFLPGANVSLSTGQTVLVQNSNGAALPSGSLPVKVLRNADGTVGLGCNQSDYVDVAGKLVITLRGVCARVARAVYAQKAGAAAVAMINTSTAFPPYEGTIEENPDTGEKYTVTIPFLGVRGVLGPSATADGDTLVAGDGGTATLTAAQVANPGYRDFASFTSGGPRNVDSFQKPDVTAPGVSVVSASVGTGFRATTISGTSMAAPMTAGAAALVTEARPTWPTEWIKSALMNTANAEIMRAYDPRRGGAGVVDARKAVDTAAVALTSGGRGTLSFGYEPLGGAYSETQEITIRNTGSKDIRYDLAASFVGSSLGTAISVSPTSVVVPAGASATVSVTLSLDAAAVAALPAATRSNFGAMRHNATGVVVATPKGKEGKGVYSLRVPFNLVPRGLSDVTAGERSSYTRVSGSTFRATVPLRNGGVHAGTADVYAWGIEDADDIEGGEDNMDVAAAGVQVLPGEALGGASSDRTLVFAVNTHGRWSNPSVSELDVAIDLQGDGTPDYYVVGVDVGAVLAGSFDGRYASFIFDAAGNLVNAWVATAPLNGSLALLPTLASDIGLGSKSGKFTYWVNAFSIVPGGLVDTTAQASFDMLKPPVSSGDFLSLAPGQTAELEVRLDTSSQKSTPVLGWLVATTDDANGTAQAARVPVGPLPTGR